MRFYTQEHKFYCGIDLHARFIYVCILDSHGEILVHRNMSAGPESFLKAIEPYREDIVVSAECMFSWYWLADLCAAENIPFILGHALYMKAIHGGKAKNDRVDSRKIAGLLRSGMIPFEARRHRLRTVAVIYDISYSYLYFRSHHSLFTYTTPPLPEPSDSPQPPSRSRHTPG